MATDFSAIEEIAAELDHAGISPTSTAIFESWRYPDQGITINGIRIRPDPIVKKRKFSDEYDNFIGKGVGGHVYAGKLEDGTKVVLKVGNISDNEVAGQQLAASIGISPKIRAFYNGKKYSDMLVMDRIINPTNLCVVELTIERQLSLLKLFVQMSSVKLFQKDSNCENILFTNNDAWLIDFGLVDILNNMPFVNVLQSNINVLHSFITPESLDVASQLYIYLTKTKNITSLPTDDDTFTIAANKL